MKTFVLVHGSWHDGRVWSRVMPLLKAAGHRVYSPTLTGYGERAHLLTPEVGVETHVIDVIDVIDRHGLTDVILVGHSYAGLVISSVADRIAGRIRHLVYLDAMVPADGESAVDIMPISQALIDVGLASDSGWRIPPLPALPPPLGLFGVTDPVDAAWLEATLSDQPVRCLQERVRLRNVAADAIARTHIHCTVAPDGFDRRPVPATQPNGSPSVVRELPTGHDCMVTMPHELAGLLLEIP